MGLMGPEINYKLESLKKDINRLTTLRTQLSGIDVTAEESSEASGANSTAIRETNASYAKIKTVIDDLLSDSIVFFTKVHDEIEIADKNAKKQVQKLQKIGGGSK